MNLQDQIDKARSDIYTTTYAMSIGEWINLYTNEELDIHPEFQRFYRWTPIQKSRFIESILLGIPVPEIFVVQRDDGVWDVVDGVQRLSTILQLVHELCNEKGEKVESLVLEKTRYLPDLEGKRWNSENEEENLSRSQKLFIKRAKLGVSIILKESDPKVQYELFQRLNTGGSRLSDQEFRNCIIVMNDPSFYEWLYRLNEFQPFINCIALTDKASLEQYDMELTLRFLIFRKMKEHKYNEIRDVGEFITDETLQIISSSSFDKEKEEEAFESTFEFIDGCLNGNAFHRYDTSKKRYGGGFLLSAFETIAIGIGYHADKIEKMNCNEVEEKAKEIWSLDEFLNNSGSGVRANSRIPRLLPLGRRIFKP